MEKLILSELYKKNPNAYFSSAPNGRTFHIIRKCSNQIFEMFEVDKVNENGVLIGSRTLACGHLYVYEVNKPTTIEDVAHNSRWERINIASKNLIVTIYDGIVWKFEEGLYITVFSNNLPIATIDDEIKSVTIDGKFLKLQVGDM